MRIAIDFDFTIFDKKTGTIIDGAKSTISEWHKQGHEITIFTNRPDYDYSTIVCILRQGGIPFHRLICGKPSYDIFIDDKCKQFKGWKEKYL